MAVLYYSFPTMFVSPLHKTCCCSRKWLFCTPG